MTWEIDFFAGVEAAIIAMPEGIQARTLKLLELIETHGANLGSPHTESMGNGLFEIRAKAKEGIGRSFFCYMKGQRVYVLHAFVKKTQKTPEKELTIAKDRMRKVKRDDKTSKTQKRGI